MALTSFSGFLIQYWIGCFHCFIHNFHFEFSKSIFTSIVWVIFIGSSLGVLWVLWFLWISAFTFKTMSFLFSYLAVQSSFGLFYVIVSRNEFIFRVQLLIVFLQFIVFI